MAGTKDRTEGLLSLVCKTQLISGSDVFNSVEGIDIESIQDSTTCYVRDDDTSFRFDEESTAAPAPGSVIQPDGVTGPGRWLVITSGGGGGSVDSVDGINGITASPTTGAVVVDGIALYARDGSNGAMTDDVDFGGFAVLNASTGTFSGAVTATTFNGVALTTGGSATDFLNAQGNYVAAGGAAVPGPANAVMRSDGAGNLVGSTELISQLGAAATSFELQSGGTAASYVLKNSGGTNQVSFGYNEGGGVAAIFGAVPVEVNGVTFPVALPGQYTMPAADGAANFLVSTDGSGQWGYTDPASLGSGSLQDAYDNGNTINATSNGNIAFSGTQAFTASMGSQIDLESTGASASLTGGVGASVTATTGVLSLTSSAGGVNVTGGGAGSTLAVASLETVTITGTGAGSTISANGFDSFTSNGTGAGAFLVNGYNGVTLEAGTGDANLTAVAGAVSVTSGTTFSLDIGGNTGTVGQVLTADGSGDATWQDASGGSSSLQDAYDNSAQPNITTAGGVGAFSVTGDQAITLASTTGLISLTAAGAAVNVSGLSVNLQAATVVDANGTSIQLEVSSTPTILLNATTSASLAADRVLTWDGTQNVYEDVSTIAVPSITIQNVAVAGPTAITDTFNTLCRVDSATIAAPSSVTLPPPAAGKQIRVKDSGGAAGSNNIAVLPNAAETIDGATNKQISTNYGSALFISDGTNWDVV